MTKDRESPWIETGVRNLDVLLAGGLPRGSVTVISGPPGSGKTIIAQQVSFHHATKEQPAIYFSTLSEPTAKTLRYLSQFDYCDTDKLDAGAVQFIDLGVILRSTGLEAATKLITEHIKTARPSLVVVDSFKVFDDLAKTKEEFRKFSYELAVNLMAWEVTALLLGEYGLSDVDSNPLFSVVDGMLTMSQRESSGEQQRFLRVFKMRGTAHSRDEYSFSISSKGVEVFAPRVTIGRDRPEEGEDQEVERRHTGITKLDELLGEGIPRGSSLLISGVAGTGKTVLSLEFVYRGALAGEKGVVFSFEETPERLRASARGMGFDLDEQIDAGMVELVFIPQPEIMVERHLLMIREKAEEMKAQRVVLDSLSVFLHKIKDPQICREKTFQLASIVQNTGAVGFFATDIPYGSHQISRLGVEETVVDGIIILSSTEEEFERQRYLEVYKLRNTAHAKGRHNMVIEQGGVAVYPRYESTIMTEPAPPPLEPSRRLPSGVTRLDELLGGGLLERSVTLVSGSAGIGKSTLAMQFILAGAARGERGIYVSFEEETAQLVKSAEVLGLPFQDGIRKGLVEMVHLAGHHVRPNQLLAILADKIIAGGGRRLVFDGVGQVADNLPTDFRDALFGLVSRFKTLGVTTLLTLESSTMFWTESATGRHFSAIADNLILLRYADERDELRPCLTIIKTRSSAHDRGRYYFSVGSGGLRIGERMGAGSPSPSPSP